MGSLAFVPVVDNVDVFERPVRVGVPSLVFATEDARFDSNGVGAGTITAARLAVAGADDTAFAGDDVDHISTGPQILKSDFQFT